ncbi:hypothetical protein RHSIM_RhsimUnG0092100 [Rhododendron simsii]|uniref:Uncharacterized protein n=1 Tax=Rhododendron simsii TaxID=118357 RepID=A0A834L2M9_RHOSS|nr:hypothetical protein RHSIM_RhsimUnG0092100 [Rhododendron simsii]
MEVFSSETACWKKVFQGDRCYRDEKMVGIPYAESGSRILSRYTTRYFRECGLGGRFILIQSFSHSAAGIKSATRTAVVGMSSFASI